MSKSQLNVVKALNPHIGTIFTQQILFISTLFSQTHKNMNVPSIRENEKITIFIVHV